MHRYTNNASVSEGQSASDRIYGLATSGRDGRRALAGVALAVSIFFLVGALSFRQVTEPRYANGLLESGIAVTTDIGPVIAENHEAMRQFVEVSSGTTFTIPGYPLDVVLSRDEVTKTTDAQLASLVLERSAALVYAEGLTAFDRTGRQHVSRFSSQGGLELAVGELSEQTHSLANTASILLVLATAVAGCFLLLVGHGWRRLRSLGLAVLGGAVPGLLVSGLARLAANSAGGSDPFVVDLRDITVTALGVPLRNYVVVALLGFVLTALAVAFGMLESRTSARIDDGFDDYPA
ncbi:MAG: hypothetical protein ABI939_06960 [Anaerolineaceae bacterium]